MRNCVKMKEQLNTKKMLFEMMGKMIPEVQFNENEGYTEIPQLQDGNNEIDEGSVETIVEALTEGLQDDFASTVQHLSNGSTETEKFDVPAEENTQVIYWTTDDQELVLLNLDRLTGSFTSWVEWEDGQRGGPETEPLQGYWGADASLEELTLIDDTNKQMYKVIKGSKEFEWINGEFNKKFETSDPSDIYPDPY